MCRSPVKGVASLIGSGTVEGTPHAVAAFLREHLADLDKAQLGEYLGHHEEFSVRHEMHVSFREIGLGSLLALEHNLKWHICLLSYCACASRKFS